MWISHFAPALILTRWSPSTPLSLLGLAGALPDALFMAFALLGIEGIKYKDKSEEFLYTNPTGGKGIVFAALVCSIKGLGAKSFTALFIAGMTHYPLDLAVHRHDVAITPGEPISQRHGFPLFDYPFAAFTTDLALFVGCLFVHARTSNPGVSQESKRNAAKAYLVAGVLATIIQADFSFFGAPTKEARWVHAPIFLFEILAISFGLGKMNNIVDRGGREQILGKKTS